ncbi:MAG: hypothetical protein EOP42_20505 [Sphingobacteriaceae bacterium]|nr:MAG: hypothetical protein EOP42_20505 [Sphingobacteriaceae bacterium]
MNKFSPLRKALLAPAMLFLCGIFLQSCTEEMPILSPDDLSAKSSSKSTVVINVNNAVYTINDVKPSTIIFATTGTDPQFPLYKQYGFDATNNNQANMLDYAVSFHTDTVGSKKYTLEISQLTLNKKTYSTANIYGNAVFKVDKLDAANNTTSGSFSYFVYDDILTPKDSIYVSGTFNIVK